MLIGILQCGHFPKADGYPEQDYLELYSKMLAGRGLTFRAWNVVDMEFPASIHDAEGWLLSGSRHGAYEDLPFIPPLEEFIRKAYAEGVPLVGICFGHQVMAQALGGKVEKFAGGWSLGRTVYDFEGEQLPLNAWHQDQVTVPPPGARTVASSGFCRYAAFAYEGAAFSVQPHPEYSDAEVGLLLDARRALLPQDRAEAARADFGKPLANAKMADRIADFFKEHAHV